MLGLKKLQNSLAQTRNSFFGRIAGLFREEHITEDTWEQLEVLLLQADVGAKTSMDLVEKLRDEINPLTMGPAEVEELLREELTAILKAAERPYLVGERMLQVVLVVGVNGSGKTTSIGKLAKYHRNQGQKVMLAAADTFRAAAIDQLKVWGERADVEVVAHQPNADPGAVVYDAIRASQSRNIDILIIDTAGRLHTKYNLMQELRKIRSIAQKQVHQAPHETLLVLDATTGQNGLSQAKTFQETIDVTGVVLAKLDSTAKGGVVFPIATELHLPVLFVATGEGIDDLAQFDAHQFVEGLFVGGGNGVH